jgi:hypothetical protein
MSGSGKETGKDGARYKQIERRRHRLTIAARDWCSLVAGVLQRLELQLESRDFVIFLLESLGLFLADLDGQAQKRRQDGHNDTKETASTERKTETNQTLRSFSASSFTAAPRYSCNKWAACGMIPTSRLTFHLS